MRNPKILLKTLYVYTLKIENCEIVIFSENESTVSLMNQL